MLNPTHRGNVSSPDDGATWTATCRRVLPGGEPWGPPEWTSSGWPTEHETGEPAPELVLSAARKAAD